MYRVLKKKSTHFGFCKIKQDLGQMCTVWKLIKPNSNFNLLNLMKAILTT